jgi:hypothetical protein
MGKKLFVLVFVLGLVTSAAQATQIDLKALGIDADFEGYASIGDGVATTGWASVLASAGGLITNALPQDDEFYTNPSRFGFGWQSNGTAGLNGKYGLQHPRKTTQNDMSAPFNGDFIGFVNLDDGDGLSQSIQSAIVGNLVEGIYTLTVAVAARPSASWNDVRYEISLVANPVLAAPDNGGLALGSRDGTVLGAPASVTLVSSTAVLGSNSQDLVYTLKVDASRLIDPNDPNAPKLGDPFAIRINVYNALEQDGVPDDGTNGGTVAPGTNYRFTQGNFDNVRLAVARPIDLKASNIDADFEGYASIGDGVATIGWASVLGSAEGLIANAIGLDDEFYTNPSRFSFGWQSNGTAGLNGKYGLQHPKKTTQNDMSAPFNGDFIGFVNLDDGDGLSQSIQSAVVGNLVEGTYTLTVAVAARPSTSWNDVEYEIALVANPVLAAPDNGGLPLGSRDGTVLGTPASVILVSSTTVLGANSQDLVYTLTVDPNSFIDPNNPDDPKAPKLGDPFAIRIDVYNALQQNGTPDDGTNGGTVAPGTNYRFTQGNFDNIRLTIQTESLPAPEPLLEEEQIIIEGSL